jgi:parallel beta-helix repeat protein
LKGAGAVAAGVGAAAMAGAGVARAHTTPDDHVHFPGTDPVYSDLQDAIDDAGEGGTIIVDAGTHDLLPTTNLYESYILQEGQTIKGVGLDTDGIPLSKLKFLGDYQFLPNNNKYYAFGLWATDNVTIEGLAFEGINLDPPDPSPPSARFVAPIVVSGDIGGPASTNVKIIGNHFMSPFPHMGVDAGNTTNSIISGNVFDDVRNGIYSSDRPSGRPATGLTISDNIITASNYGIVLERRDSSNLSSDHTVSGNDIDAENQGIRMYWAYNSLVTDNTIRGDFRFGIITLRSSDNIISQNTMSGTATLEGISLQSTSHDIQVLDNDLSGLVAKRSQVRITRSSYKNYFFYNTFGSLDSNAVAGVWIESRLNELSDNDFRETMMIVGENEVKLPGWLAPEELGCVYLTSRSFDNYVFESGNFPQGTGGAHQQCLDEGTNNRVVGLPANEMTDNPGIGEHVRNRAAAQAAEEPETEEEFF